MHSADEVGQRRRVEQNMRVTTADGQVVAQRDHRRPVEARSLAVAEPELPHLKDSHLSIFRFRDAVQYSKFMVAYLT